MSNKVENIGKTCSILLIGDDYFGEVYNRKAKRMKRQ
jgi:hypothetical protein